ncbi:MAG: myxococcus cysteine-rich repeat containing protein [candidate division SR1 bacterium]|nr:myxococcus cysteine-rich repeat containing protein [candidate division SR1 bacterium]
MKIKGYYLLCCIFFVLVTTISSYGFGGNAVFKMQVIPYSPAYNTGRMYCETPIKVMVDSPTEGATSIENMIYFNTEEISPIPNRYTNFRPNPKLLSNVLTGTIKNGNTLRFGLYGSSSNTGSNLLLSTFRVINTTGVSTTTLQYSGNNLIEKAGGGSLFSGVQNLTINFATGPCLIDNQGPVISVSTISNGAYRVGTGQDIVFSMNDWSGIGKHYRYLTTNYANVSGDNYVPDYSTGDNQYGVNSGSIQIKIGSTVFSLGNTNITLTAIGKTRALLDRGYTGIIYAATLPSFGKEVATTILATGRDNLNNLSTSTMTFNSPRAPFVYRTGIAARNGGTTITTPYSYRLPNTSTNVYPFLKTIRFATLDDWAGVDSGSLKIIIKTGSISGGTIWSENMYSSGVMLSGLLYSYVSNGVNGSNAITHDKNYDITWNIGGTGGFNLPYNTEIYVVISGYDLASIPQPFVQAGFTSDQNNYFHFTTRNSCVAMQCIDWISIDTGSNPTTYTGTDLFVTGGKNPYISGDILYCSIPTIGIDIQTGGVTFYTGYTGNILEIQPTVQSGFTTYLDGDTLYIKKYICGDESIQTPNRSGINEQCDDGNTINNDGCSDTCQIELDPTATVIYMPGSGARTSGNVLAMLTGYSEPLTGINATGYLFTGNGSFTFTFLDFGGNTGVATAIVNRIDKIPPTATILYAPASGSLTSGNVFATLTGYSEPLTGINTTGHLFTGNGTFTFTFLDLAGNTGSVTAIVNRIDKIKPTATVIYNPTSGAPTSGNVLAMLTGYSEPLTGINATGRLFTSNGIFGFTFSDLAGNTGTVIATVTRIDKIKPTATVIYMPGSGARTSGNVLAMLTGYSEPLTGINTTGHLFTGNGNFTFTFLDFAGNTGNTTAMVNRIDKIPPTFSGATSGVTYATGITIYFTDNNPGATATVNGNPYLSGTSIMVDGTYTVTIRDIAGNTIGATFIIHSAICGNGILEGAELYDDGIHNGTPGYSNILCNGLVLQTGNGLVLQTGNGVIIQTGNGGGSWLAKDICPNGDLSPSYYDTSCESQGSHASATCTTITQQNEFIDAYNWAYNLGITTVAPICDANLDGKITRKQLAKMMAEFTVQIIGKQPDTKILCAFADTKDETPEMKFYMKISCQLGLMGRESDGRKTKKNFNPNNYVTRAEFGTVLSRLIFAGKYNTSDAIHRYDKHLKILQKIQIMNDISKPTMKELRGYVLLMLKRSDQYIKNN